MIEYYTQTQNPELFITHAAAVKEHQERWEDIAMDYNWENKNNIFVQLFVNKNGEVKDSVSYISLTENIIAVTNAYDNN